MSQNFNFENGIVGKYKGIQVEVISYSKYKKMPSPQSNIIYAISTGSDQNLVLVLKDICIGYMTPTGEVTEERPRPFGGKKPKKREEKIEKEIDLVAMINILKMHWIEIGRRNLRLLGKKKIEKDN